MPEPVSLKGTVLPGPAPRPCYQPHVAFWLLPLKNSASVSGNVLWCVGGGPYANAQSCCQSVVCDDKGWIKLHGRLLSFSTQIDLSCLSFEGHQFQGKKAIMDKLNVSFCRCHPTAKLTVLNSCGFPYVSSGAGERDK